MGTLKNEITGTQCRKVREYLSSGASLTQMQALDKFGIARLASRINDLKNAGFQTGKKMVPVLNRNGQQVKVAQYFKAVEVQAQTASQ